MSSNAKISERLLVISDALSEIRCLEEDESRMDTVLECIKCLEEELKAAPEKATDAAFKKLYKDFEWHTEEENDNDD